MKYWAARLGQSVNKPPGYSHGIRWSDEKIKHDLLKVIGLFQNRMPSCNELKKINRSDLASAIIRHSGFRYWARELGIDIKGSETHFASKWELNELKFYGELGYDVTRMSSGAPFDLIVNGYRVDVKAANEGVYRGGYAFAGMKRGIDCDFFDLLCIEDDAVKHRLILPAIEAEVVGVTITPRTLRGNTKYSKFINAVNLLTDDGNSYV